MIETDKSVQNEPAGENDSFPADDAVNIEDIAASGSAGECDCECHINKSDEKGEDSQTSAESPAEKEQKSDSSADDLKRQKDQYLRLMAEFDNYKRRVAREYDQMVEQSGERIMRDIIDIRENLERALAAAPQGDTLAEGVKLISVKLDEVLKKHGLPPFGLKGETFDPELHDAMMKTPDETVPAENIAQVYEKGYKLRSRIIRHAKVVVSSGPAQ